MNFPSLLSKINDCSCTQQGSSFGQPAFIILIGFNIPNPGEAPEGLGYFFPVCSGCLQLKAFIFCEVSDGFLNLLLSAIPGRTCGTADGGVCRWEKIIIRISIAVGKSSCHKGVILSEEDSEELWKSSESVSIAVAVVSSWTKSSSSRLVISVRSFSAPRLSRESARNFLPEIKLSIFSSMVPRTMNLCTNTF